MDASEYQRLAARTLIAKPDFPITSEQVALALDVIQVGARAGEVAEIVKKGVFHQHGLDELALMRACTSVILAAQSVAPGMTSFAPLPSDKEIMVIWNLIGLLGEVGEIVRILMAGEPFDLAKAKKEMGDADWYLSAICTTLGLDRSEIMTDNIEKLKARYPNGYNSADSIARVDVQGPEAQ